MLAKKTFSLFALLSLVISLGGPVQSTFAQTTSTSMDPGFNPDSILTDSDMFDVNGMSHDYLINFLRSKGTLADLIVKDTDGADKTAADVIWRVANSYKINPKYLLALIQKEQSLVEDPDPSQRQLDWAAGYGVCDSCSKDDPDIQQFKGFASQIEWAAKQHREKYLMQLLAFGTTIAGKGVGITMQVDGRTVTPMNNATAMLYTYTPHIHGNYNLWKIWQRWFSLAYPSGTLVQGEPSGKTYLIQAGQKREFASEAVLLSMADPDKVIQTSDTDLTAYPDGDKMLFPKYSIIKTEEGRLYLIVSNGKRLIADEKTLHKFGFMDDDVIDAQESDVQHLATLDPITAATVFPSGALLKSAKSSTVWYVEDNVKHALQDEIFLKLYFTGRPIKVASDKTIASLTLGEPYSLQDGELVRGKASPAVYVVENGQLRPIPSAQVFEGMGYKWQNVAMIPDRVIVGYATSSPLTLASAMLAATTSTPQLVLNQ